MAENLEKFRSTELYGVALEGSTIFLCRSSLGCTSIESCQLAAKGVGLLIMQGIALLIMKVIELLIMKGKG